jgi:hypothetical protein
MLTGSFVGRHHLSKGRLLGACYSPPMEFMHEIVGGQWLTLYLRHNDAATTTAFQFLAEIKSRPFIGWMGVRIRFGVRSSARSIDATGKFGISPD